MIQSINLIYIHFDIGKIPILSILRMSKTKIQENIEPNEVKPCLDLPRHC